MRKASFIDLLAPFVSPLVLTFLSWGILHLQDYYLIDDAYISFRYAKNLALGHGLVWNAGEYVEGYTNFLWVSLLAPFAWLKLDLVIPAACLGTIFSIGTLEIVRRISRDALLGQSVMGQLLPSLLLAVNPSFVYWTTSGMETSLFCFLVLLALYLLVHGPRDRRHYLLSGIAMALACLTRPEGILVSAVYLSVDLLIQPEKRKHWLKLCIPGAVVLSVVSVQFALRLHFYGYLFPNTFYAKVIVGSVSLMRGAIASYHFLIAGGILVLVGGLCIFSRSVRALPAVVHGCVLFFIYTTYLFVIGVDHPGWYRFFVPLMPITIVAFSKALLLFTQSVGSLVRARGRHGPWPTRATGIGLMAIAMVAHAFFWTRAEPRTWKTWRDGGRATRLIMDQFFKAYVPSRSLVAVGPIGYFGYYGDYRVLDSWGLVDTHIAHLPREANVNAKFGHDKDDWLYVLGQLPDYIATYRFGPPPPLPGYDVCWPSHLMPTVLIYRRNFALTGDGLKLGVPPGFTRRSGVLPRCDS